MRISIDEQSRNFLKACKKNNLRVFSKADIKKSVREHLVSIWMMFSPFDNIYLVKKSSESKESVIKNNLYAILGQMWGVLSWDIVPYYYLGKKKNPKEFLIFNPTKNWESYLGNKKEYKIIRRKSLMQRNEKRVNIDGVYVSIEDPLSYICNFIKDKEDEKVFQEFIMSQDFEHNDILFWLLHKYKLSWLSRLALFYYNHWKKWKYSVIKNAIEQSGKKLDRRNNKVKLIKLPTKKEIQTHEYDTLID